MTTYFFLRYVPRESKERIEAAGFRRFVDPDDSNSSVWVEPMLYTTGELKGVDGPEAIRDWLMRRGVGQIFEAKMWGRSNE